MEVENLDLYRMQLDQIETLDEDIDQLLELNDKNMVKGIRNKVRFGVCFDVDGVLARGSVPIPAAVEAFKRLCDDNGVPKYPVAFVTNSLSSNSEKAEILSRILQAQVRPDHLVQAQGPLELFTSIHDKFCLVVGQGKIFDIVRDLGVKKFCTIEDVAEAYPLLDMINHENRKRIAREGYTENKDFPKIEAILLLGEPVRWESSLQLIVDLLRTEGKPESGKPLVSDRHIPVLACNMDVQFMDRSHIPRYGHGAFLLCLEALYKKITGRDLTYTALIGKPSEITYRFAEHTVARQALKLNIRDPLLRMYFIGDTPEVDIVGSNLYQRFIDRLHTRLRSRRGSYDAKVVDRLIDPSLSDSRNVPHGASLLPQTIEEVRSLLVCTGVYRPDLITIPDDYEKNFQGHRDFPNKAELYRPTRIVQDAGEAIDWILDCEQLLAE